MTALAAAALGLAALAIAASGIALLVVPDPRDRLHYLGAPGVVAPFLLVVALAAGGGGVAVVALAVLLALTMAFTSAVLTHAALAALEPRRGGKA